MSDSTQNANEDKLEAAFEELENDAPAPSGGTSIGGTLAIFLALIAIGIASYSGWESYRQSSVPETGAEIARAVTKLESALAVRDSRITALESRLNELGESDGAASEDLAKNLEAMSARIQTELNQIRGRLTTSSEDWLFAEVEYLVRMANQRVLMEKDSESALQLLMSADRIVSDAQGLMAHELRAALAADMAALKAAESPDRQGIYLALSAQIGQISALKRTLPTLEPVTDVAPAPAASETLLQTAKRTASGAVARLGQLVEFRRQGVEVKPILPPEQEYYLRQNLVLKLQMAQMALLEGDAEVYRVSLQEAAKWVTQSFDDNAASAAMLETLARLSEREVSVVLPDISGSLNAARKLLEGFHRSEAE